jgi:uncharacterized membrane protein
MSYGYEPPKNEHQGTWGEAFMITKIVFQVLAGPLAIMLGTLGLLILILMALLTKPILALIPLAIVVLGVMYLVRRDKRLHEEAMREMERPKSNPYR